MRSRKTRKKRLRGRVKPVLVSDDGALGVEKIATVRSIWIFAGKYSCILKGQDCEIPLLVSGPVNPGLVGNGREGVWVKVDNERE